MATPCIIPASLASTGLAQLVVASTLTSCASIVPIPIQPVATTDVVGGLSVALLDDDGVTEPLRIIPYFLSTPCLVFIPRGVVSQWTIFCFTKNIPNFVTSENKVNFVFSQFLIWSGVPGSNWRPHVPQTCALPLRQPPIRKWSG